MNFFENFESLVLFLIGILSVTLIIFGIYIGSFQPVLYGLLGAIFIGAIIYINKHEE